MTASPRRTCQNLQLPAPPADDQRQERLKRLVSAVCCLLLVATSGGCSRHHKAPQPLHRSRFYTALPPDDTLTGNMVPVHDPSLIRRTDGTYMIFDTDIPFLLPEHFIEQRCSTDLLSWHGCGYVFDQVPLWVRRDYPEVTGLWAPDISYFHGLYHLYYAASVLNSQHSAIGLATNVTLDPRDPRNHWVDRGKVIVSENGGSFNAIDANIFIEPAGRNGEPRVWLNYGSFWKGIFQQELDPATGKLLAGSGVVHLAEQPVSRRGAVEGAAMIEHHGWFYLFASVGLCCDIPIEHDTYQEIVGRARSPQGPFTAEDGGALLRGGGTVLLSGDANWIGPGGASLWQDKAADQTLVTFHALHRRQNGALDLWVERVLWKDDWPVLQPLP